MLGIVPELYNIGLAVIATHQKRLRAAPHTADAFHCHNVLGLKRFVESGSQRFRRGRRNTLCAETEIAGTIRHPWKASSPFCKIDGRCGKAVSRPDFFSSTIGRRTLWAETLPSIAAASQLETVLRHPLQPFQTLFRSRCDQPRRFAFFLPAGFLPPLDFEGGLGLADLFFEAFLGLLDFLSFAAFFGFAFGFAFVFVFGFGFAFGDGCGFGFGFGFFSPTLGRAGSGALAGAGAAGAGADGTSTSAGPTSTSSDS